MKRLGFLGLVLLCGFIPIGGGRFTVAPPTPVQISFNPPAPTISDNFLVNAQVANINVAMSDGSTFAGLVGFSPPTTSSCAQNGNAALFSEQQTVPPLLLTNKNGGMSDDGIRVATVTATQNGVTICNTISVTVVPATTQMVCAAISGPYVDVGVGADLNAVAQANPAGTVFRLAAGTIFNQTNFVNVKLNQAFVGAGFENGGAFANSTTIIDGGGVNHSLIGFYPAGAPGGVRLQGLTIRNYGGNAMIVTSDNWTICGNTIRNAVAAGSNSCISTANEPNCGGGGISVEGGNVLVANNLITSNDQDGITGIGGLSANHGSDTITGNEISFNNTGHHDVYDNAAGVKLLIAGNPFVMTYNYVHDNLGAGLWCDTVRNGEGGFPFSCQYTGNTVVNNAQIGIFHEVSDLGDIGFNVVANNGIGPCYGSGNGS